MEMKEGRQPQIASRKSSVVCLCAAFFFLLSAKESGCRHNALPNGETRPATEARSADFLLKKLRSHERPELQTMSAQAKIYFESEGQNID